MGSVAPGLLGVQEHEVDKQASGGDDVPSLGEQGNMTIS